MKYYTRSNGQRIEVRSMNDFHLKAAMDKIERNARRSRKQPGLYNPEYQDLAEELQLRRRGFTATSERAPYREAPSQEIVAASGAGEVLELNAGAAADEEEAWAEIHADQMREELRKAGWGPDRANGMTLVCLPKDRELAIEVINALSPRGYGKIEVAG